MAIEPEMQAQFLALLRQSELVDEATLAKVLQDFANSDALPFGDSITSLTAMLVGKGVLTNWQVTKLRNGQYKGYCLDDFVLLDHLISTSGKSSAYLARDRRNMKLCKVTVFPPRIEEPPHYRYEVEDV